MMKRKDIFFRLFEIVINSQNIYRFIPRFVHLARSHHKENLFL